MNSNKIKNYFQYLIKGILFVLFFSLHLPGETSEVLVNYSKTGTSAVEISGDVQNETVSFSRGSRADSDGDGVDDSIDCLPYNIDHWALPGVVRDLQYTNDSKTDVSWLAPLEPGCSAGNLVYDFIRSTDPTDFSSALCIETGGADTTASDPETPSPGTVFYYAIKARHLCGVNFGEDSEGAKRNGAYDCTNNEPYFLSTPSDATEFNAYTYLISCFDDDGDPLSLGLSDSDTCGGSITLDNGDGTGIYGNWTPSEAQGGLPCTVGITCNDTKRTVSQNTVINVIEQNQSPFWVILPTTVMLRPNESYDKINGSGADDDLPNSSPGAPGYITCDSAGSTCSFGITLSGSGSGAVDCNLSFTAGSSEEDCTVTYRLTDGYGNFVTHDVSISVSKILFVNDDATGLDNGSSWEDAFTSLNDAIDFADSDYKIYVAEGTYTRPFGGTEPVLTMKDGVEIYGGFIGNENTLLDRGDTFSHPTILDGENMSFHVVIGASNAILDGFYIVNGSASGSSPDNRGGGMYNDLNSNLEIKQCHFENNDALFGGAIYNYSCDPTIYRCNLKKNNANFGGGMYNNNASPAIGRLDFTENTAGNGAGLYNGVSADPDIINTIFRGNKATGQGGAIYNNNSSNSISFTTISGNRASIGGAIYNWASTPTITKSILWGNSGTTSDPEIADISSTSSVSYCVVEGGIAGSTNVSASYTHFRGYPDLHLATTGWHVDYTSSTTNEDFDGNPRPSGSKSDFGAYELMYEEGTWFVDCSVSSSGAGITWGSAFKTVQEAIDAASAGDSIWVAKGTYTGAGSATDPVIELKSGIKLFGGFLGLENYLHERGPDHITSTLDGENFHNHVVVAASDTTIDRFIIENGRATGSGNNGNGAGIYANSVNALVVSDCTIRNNTAIGNGAGLFCDGASVTLQDSIFLENSATNGGGLAAVNSSTLQMEGCHLSMNIATQYGAGFYLNASLLTAANCILTSNSAQDEGGAGYLSNGTVCDLKYCTCSNNEAAVSGGTLSIVSSTSNILGTILWGSSAAVNPVISESGATVDIIYSNIEGGYSGLGNKNEDPQFISSNDVHLHPGSPCIDTAEFSLYYNEIDRDFEGSLRPVNGRFDMGAYEFKPISADWFVNDDASGTGDGLSWANAFTDAQSAMDIAASGDIIFIAAGTYQAPSSEFILEMHGDIDVFGGFTGSENYTYERQTDYVGLTVFDGLDSSSGVQLQSNSTVEGLAVTNGYRYSGAAFDNIGNVGVLVTNCRIENCSADYNGGAFCHGGGSSYSNLEISHCTMLGNSAGSYGGAVSVASVSYWGIVSVFNSQFIGNDAVSGGGAYNSQATLLLYDCIFDGNTASSGSGAYSLYNTFTYIDGCSFYGGTGSGYAEYYSKSEVVNSIFKNNGRGLYNRESNSLYKNCEFINNKSDLDGGGIYLLNYTTSTILVTIENCLFAFNHAKYGAAIYVDGITPHIVNCTAYMNHSDHEGGGIYCDDNTNATIENSIFWKNIGYLDGNEIYLNGSASIQLSYTVIEGGYSGTDNLDADPLFIDAHAANFHIQGISPARDSGNPDAHYNDPDRTRNDRGYYGWKTKKLDHDYDGMETWWEREWNLDYLDPGDAAGNSDGDYYTNLDEFNHRTSPLFRDLWFVDIDASGTENGRSWTNAFTSIQDAIDSIENGGMIWIASGLYSPATVGNDPVVHLKEGIEIYGGFEGDETMLNERNITSNPVTLDGNNASYHTIIASSRCIIDGLNIIAGSASGTTPDDNGGGLFSELTYSLSVANCQFSQNYSANEGGGLYALHTFLDLNNCTFIENQSDSYGGGVFVESSHLLFTDSLLQNNTSDYGGGMRLEYGGTLERVEFVRNLGEHHGGGLNMSGQGAAIKDCIFKENYVNASIYNGGGAIALGGGNTKPLIENTIFIGNHAVNECGAALHNSYGAAPEVVSCLFIRNVSDRWGGAIYTDGCSPHFYNCNFINNKSMYGGTLYVRNGGSPTFINSISRDNFALGSGDEIYNNGSTVTMTYSDVAGGYSGTGNIDENPLYIHVPLFWDSTIAAGTTTTVVVNSAATYSIGDIIEISDDTVARQVTAASGTVVTFTPATSEPTKIYQYVENWGPGETDLEADFRLCQVDAGQAQTSLCVDSGSDTASNVGMDNKTTRTDDVPDSGLVDMGYHYPLE